MHWKVFQVLSETSTFSNETVCTESLNFNLMSNNERIEIVFLSLFKVFKLFFYNY